MSRVGLKLKVLTGDCQGKIGEVIEVSEDNYDKNGNFQQNYQILKFKNGTTEKYPLYHIGMLELVTE